MNNEDYDGRYGPIPDNIPKEHYGFWIAAKEREAAEKLRVGAGDNDRSFKYKRMQRIRSFGGGK